jgi:hypothetical protein
MGEVALRQYTIYDRPRDYPEGFVVREWLIERGNPQPQPGRSWTAVSLAGARSWVPDGLFRIPRSADDDPRILETWT